jgi:hypothetical protein
MTPRQSKTNPALISALEAVANLCADALAKLDHSSGLEAMTAHSEIKQRNIQEKTAAFYRFFLPLRAQMIALLADSYQNHPEAKSLGPDGKPCEFDTRGLLQRAHIIANWPPVYIGKESDRHWEEGEDPSLLEFKALQYRRKGNAVADDEQLSRIAKVPKREFMRQGINQHTLEKICRREPVRAIKLAKCLKVLEQYEAERLHPSTPDPVEPVSD